MKQKSANVFGMVALAWVPTLMCMMTVGVVVPFIGTLGRDLGTSAAQLGLAIALFSMPTAVLATMSGSLIDRYGVRSSMIFAACISALGSALASQAHSLLALDIAMVVSGLGFGGTCIAAPCLLIGTLADGARIRAMSFFSTFAPTGYAAGLLLAVPFTATGNWRTALLVHAALMAIAFVALVVFLPRVEEVAGLTRDPLRETLARMLRVFREPRALRLGVAIALPNAISYGTSLAAPAYLAQAHHLSIATSSATVAVAKIIAMIIGGLSMGYLLSRAVRPALLFTIMATIGLVAQTILFLSPTGILVATGGLVLWLFSFGGMAGGAMTLLPSVVSDPARAGAASGLMNQFISLASFAAPSTWLALHEGSQFVMLADACLAISVIAFPATAATALRPARV